MTNKEVAELAGVSGAAVSRYLNGGYLSAEKRERIAAAIEQTGYVPSANARILRLKKSNTIGIILTKTDEYAMGGVTSGLEKYLYAGGYGSSLAYVGDNDVALFNAMRSMLERQIDGIVIISSSPVPGDLELFERARVPVVIVGQHTGKRNCVRFDNFGAAYDLASSLGCTLESRVAYVDVGGSSRSFGSERRRGFLAGLERVGVLPDNVRVVEGGFSIEDGRRAGEDILSTKGRPQFIACATDTLAVGVLAAIRAAFGSISSSRAPRVSGFGDDPVLQALAGPLPTVRFDYEECGIKAAEMMVSLLKDEVPGVNSVILGYQVVGV